MWWLVPVVDPVLLVVGVDGLVFIRVLLGIGVDGLVFIRVLLVVGVDGLVFIRVLLVVGVDGSVFVLGFFSRTPDTGCILLDGA